MKIRVAGDLQSDSIVDGLGVRTVLWTQGCGHNCPNCHNPHTWDFNGGELVEVDEVIERIYELECQDGITFSGGDPFYQAEACALIARAIKKTKMNIWCYTGFTFEQLIKMSKKDKTIMDFLKNIDVLVDGPFIQKLQAEPNICVLVTDHHEPDYENDTFEDEKIIEVLNKSKFYKGSNRNDFRIPKRRRKSFEDELKSIFNVSLTDKSEAVAK